MLDANAIAGLLHEVFGSEMTAEPAEWAGCGNRAEVGMLLAFTLGPGIVQTAEFTYIDARGAT